ncbi:hypothetical protein ACJIZ3_009879 [Penstemon smallii]|uniref:Uncharacterized protein n=1 Tax=Penstemon smallii TaxID=265156 RepID=A0ABD3TG27_9LAMI
MAATSTIGNWAFKAFTAGLGVATIYLTATFSVNVYRGIAWHSAQSTSRSPCDATSTTGDVERMCL